MSDRDLEHLALHVELWRAAIRTRALVAGPDPDRTTVGEAVAATSSLLSEIAQREAARGLVGVEGLARLGLTATQRHVVWLLAALAVDRAVAEALAGLTRERSVDPTSHAIKLVVHGFTPSREAIGDLSPAGPLRRLGLVVRSDAGDVHERQWTWTVSQRALALLHGDEAIAADLARVVRIVDARPADELACARWDPVRDAVRAERRTVLACGLGGLGRRSILAAAAARADIAVLDVDVRALSATDAQLVAQLRAIALECRLLDRVPLLANVDALAEDKLALVGSELVAQLDGLVLATCGIDRPAIRWDRPTVVVELERPPSRELGALWLRALGQGSASDAEYLAAQFPLAPALIHHAAAAAKARAAGEALADEDIYAGIRSVLDDRLGHHAHRVTVTQTWGDLVLPADQLETIRELIARVRQRHRVYEQWGFAAKLGRGLGVSALFSGPPGTGKTMVAALIARELELPLYQVDLGKVVSKWIGETEKNLAAVFDAAEAGHAILLFDEADALFGKRTEVKSSNDRHANLETNYLLQRMESFSGVCLLTSNHERDIDPAFQRRLSLHLRFELPGVEERARLWRALIPEAAPVAGELDVDGLARRFAMSGGYIRNAALRAAFVAADRDEPITTTLLERAARREYEGMGKLAM